ncbi:ATP-binding protein [Collinsella ihumii]|uniref:ATP-binding protein n=1 Tax=Collinsella ihumii TaxID=1720204 RepID=UPI0025AAC88D|nr:ATP-binding protein [Collinsella ihumii]MDN0055216.1 ATP-binding protein [Collinsella ihumii]
MAARQADELFRGFLLELMEARYGTASTVFCTQFRHKDWHARLGGGVHADAIMDRIVHDAAWVNMGEMNMRRELGPVSNRTCTSPVSDHDIGRYQKGQILNKLEIILMLCSDLMFISSISNNS